MTISVYTIQIQRNKIFEHTVIQIGKLIEKYQNDEKYKDIILELNNILDYIEKELDEYEPF